VEVRARDELEGAFSTMARDRVGAVMVEGGAMLFGQRRRIADLALKNRLPTMYEYREFVDAGGLISYGPSYRAVPARCHLYR